MSSHPPTYISWNDLLDNSKFPDWSYQSCSNNPDCKLKNDGCSLKMDKPDLCFWHSRRMGRLGTLKCACKEFNKSISGDAIGRILVRKYYDIDKAVVTYCGQKYCCGPCENADAEIYICGDMLVGECCEKYHTKLTKIPDEKETDEDC